MYGLFGAAGYISPVTHSAHTATGCSAPSLPPGVGRYHTASHWHTASGCADVPQGCPCSPGGTHGKESWKAACSQRVSIGSLRKNLGHRGKKTGLQNPTARSCEGMDSRSIHQRPRFDFGHGSFIWAPELCRAKKYQKQIQLYVRYKMCVRRGHCIREYESRQNGGSVSGGWLPAELNLCSWRWFILSLKTGYFRQKGILWLWLVVSVPALTWSVLRTSPHLRATC